MTSSETIHVDTTVGEIEKREVRRKRVRRPFSQLFLGFEPLVPLSAAPERESNAKNPNWEI